MLHQLQLCLLVKQTLRERFLHKHLLWDTYGISTYRREGEGEKVGRKGRKKVREGELSL